MCEVDNDCAEAPYFYCGTDGYCHHKSVFPIFGLEWAGYVLFTIIMALCNVAGIGGGAIDNPIWLFFTKFHIKGTIANSKFVIMIASFARFLYILKQ